MVKTAGSIFSPNTSGPLRRRVRKKYPPRPPDLVVTGELTPDVTGNYFETGTYGGQPFYKHVELDWFIWYDPGMEPIIYTWRITQAPGDTTDPTWYKTTAAFEPVTGSYLPLGGTIGTATVTAP